MLTLKNIHLKAGEHTLLKDFNFSLEAGTMTAIVAPSGFGKTTLLRTLAGLANPESGEIFFKGKSLKDSNYPEYRRQIVWVSQNPVMFDLSVRENLQKAFAYHTSKSKFNEASAIKLLSDMGIEEKRLDQTARSLSVGQQQRVAIARALLIKPEVLLLDEPTSALDADCVSLVEGVLQTYVRDNNKAMLIVTHNLEQASRLCGRIVDLKESHGIN